MNENRTRWNPPGWPWELELITLLFFLIALFVPFYFHQIEIPATSAREIQQATNQTGIAVGRETLSTQFGFLMAVVVVALYILHIAFAAAEIKRITASPLHLFSPVIFAVIAYFRVVDSPGVEQSALSFVDGSIWQVAILVIGVALVTSMLSWLRRYRYMTNFDDIHWDMETPARYDGSYFSLLLHWRPLLYAPRRYLACPEGIVIEGWFYAMPMGFSDVHSMSKLSGAGMLNTGQYFASSAHSLIRLELHDMLKAVYISPENRDEFIRYCVPFIARKRASGHAPATRHGLLRSHETQHGAVAQSNRATAHGERPPASDPGPNPPAS
ncbi:MAG TPA: hypothetical protein PKE26_08275 [Kiritimatiellia bacterium]|nr:hypothetical protein [Kiritimatiellia bacterium]HMP96621.1 hypothetical protein [Kiritimatiellia bacterium]